MRGRGVGSYLGWGEEDEDSDRRERGGGGDDGSGKVKHSTHNEGGVDRISHRASTPYKRTTRPSSNDGQTHPVRTHSLEFDTWFETRFETRFESCRRTKGRDNERGVLRVRV